MGQEVNNKTTRFMRGNQLSPVIYCPFMTLIWWVTDWSTYWTIASFTCTILDPTVTWSFTSTLESRGRNDLLYLTFR